MPRLWHLSNPVGKRLGFPFFMEVKVSIGTDVQEYPDFFAEVTCSMKATRAVIPKSSLGFGALFLAPYFWGGCVTDITVGGCDIIIIGCDIVIRTSDITLAIFIFFCCKIFNKNSFLSIIFIDLFEI